MAGIGHYVEMVAASLWVKPADLTELMKRDFLNGFSEYSVFQLIALAKRRGYVYEKTDTCYTYKKALDALNRKGYELD